MSRLNHFLLKFFKEIYEEQKEILREIYYTLVNLRMVLSTHPKAIAVAPPKEWNDRDEVFDI